MAKPKVLTEQQTRRSLLNVAKSLGFDIDLKRIFNRYDTLLANCHDEKERRQMQIMANAEVHRLFNFRNALVVDGQEIIPADPDYKEE